MQTLYEELNPPPRILMGPGPVDADPRVLKAMSMPLLGQFDPEFTRYMNETRPWISIEGFSRRRTDGRFSSMGLRGQVSRP